MDDAAERCWAQLEGVRSRMHSICKHADPKELSSIDAEIVEVRDLVWRSLRGSANSSAVDS